jgi:c-di-AMP phosphodiesterase-like protein
MHRYIAILRIVGLITLLIFIVSLFVIKNASSLNYWQKNLIQISLGSFVILALLQGFKFYNYYIKNYLRNSKEKEVE